MKLSSPVTAAIRVGLFSFMIVALVSLVYHASKDKIAENEYLDLLHSLQAVLSPDSYDNDLVNDVILLQTQTIYRARKAGKPIAAIIQSTTPYGYNGDIQLLIALDMQGRIIGVRVLKHKETPGLGDKIDLKKSDWILNFAQKSLADNDLSLWAVKRDGGLFDQFTGATITPRAIVNEVKKTALFFQHNQQVIFK
ncbi:MAG: electron transport complex subunit RsxG [Methyloprofundus sp.]|nr:electron transport complex subunit RsxG [Methyloprofundus sp.]